MDASVYLLTLMDEDVFVRRLALELRGAARGTTITADGLEIRVRRNEVSGRPHEEDERHRSYPLLLDIASIDAAAVARLLRVLDLLDVVFVAECDFLDELPNRGRSELADSEGTAIGDDEPLRYLVAAYFHQDWNIETPTLRGVLELFAREEPEELVRGARDEAVALLAGDLDDEAIEQILDDFGLAVDPPAHGLSYGRWLALVADVLTAALREGGGG